MLLQIRVLLLSQNILKFCFCIYIRHMYHSSSVMGWLHGVSGCHHLSLSPWFVTVHQWPRWEIGRSHMLDTCECVPIHFTCRVCTRIVACDIHTVDVCGLQIHLAMDCRDGNWSASDPVPSRRSCWKVFSEAALQPWNGSIVKPKPTQNTLAAWFVIAQSWLYRPSSHISWNLRTAGCDHVLLQPAPVP